ncbi:RcnB family protein [Phenylobacterium sp.]|uniref:RcnB family protein n=1 Tax=Phenylobacterium sp. TaxID=1871053 RepID=UPI00286DDEAD|nr:RcnB family protein [Phenylobacterium sp.]
MKTVIKGALALVLLASTATVALAQDNGGESRGDGVYNPAMRASSRNVPPSLQERQPAPQAQTPQAQAEPQPQPQGQPQGRQGGRRGDPNWQSRQPGQEGQQAGRDGQRWNDGEGPRPGQSWQGQRQDRDGRHDRDGHHERDPRWNNNGSNSHGWNNNGDWRSDRHQQRPRFDRRHYGHNYRSHQRYRGYAYRPPSGFYIRSWSYGDQLPRSWWSSQYRLNDWWSYGLPIPPIGYEYVRVGADVMLVDMFSGRVVQVIHRVFW